MNKLKQEAIDDIQRMARDGMPVRDIAQAVGVSKITAHKYVLTVIHPDTVSDKPQKRRGRKRVLHWLKCGYCERTFLDKSGEKTSDLKHGRIQRAYCTHRCAMNYRSAQRDNDKCKRCGVTRKELAIWRTPDSPYRATGVCFSHGYCPRCWGLLYQYKGNEELVAAHELNQQLKKEIKDDLECKEHSRPSESAARSHRRGAKGEGRSSASAGDLGSFFSHLAVS